jgi:hypothetical protein
MLAAIVFTMAGLGCYWLLIKSYQLVSLARYNDDARAVLQTFAGQFQRLQTSDTDLITGKTYTRWLFSSTTGSPTGRGLLWDSTALTAGVNLNSICIENSSTTPVTTGSSLTVMIGESQNGIPATVTREVFIIDPANGGTTATAPETANEGELLLGKFTILYSVNGYTPPPLTLSVLRAAP